MLFNSLNFLIFFFPLIFLIRLFMPFIKKNIYILLVIFVSLVFYSIWEFYQIFFLVFSIFSNYYFSSLILKSGNKLKKTIFIFAILLNIFFLGYFKYTNFFIDNLNGLFNLNINTLNIILPLAISFYTFQQISFLIDIYKGNLTKVKFLNYFLYVSFFPQLIAGPIVHYSEFNHQVYKINKLSFKFINLGLFIFALGLFKKIFIADFFAIHVDYYYDNYTNQSLIDIHPLIISFFYTFQIYFDFSAYSDMAIGLALMFNIRLPINFNSPLKSTNISDFWKRWHITLSRFIESVIFNPIINSLRLKIRKKNYSYSKLIFIYPLFISFLLSGLWHGANWTFVIWGCLHAVYIILHQFTKSLNFINIPKLIKQFFILYIVSFAFIFFRSDNLTDSINIIGNIFDDFDLLLSNYLYILILILTSLFCFYMKNIYEILNYKNPKKIYRIK